MATRKLSSLSEAEFSGYLDTQSQMLNQSFVDTQHYQIAHLTSERGRKLNGKSCRVVGFSGATHETRFHVEIAGESKLRLKKENLIPTYCLKYMNGAGAVTWAIDRDELHEMMREAVRKQYYDGVLEERKDARYRGELMSEYIEQTLDKDSDDAGSTQSPPKQIKCAVSGSESLPFQELDKLDRIMSLSKVACCGNNKVDFFNFTRGLKPDMIGKHRLTKRVNEFILSGLCEMCQIVIMESDLGGDE